MSLVPPLTVKPCCVLEEELLVDTRSVPSSPYDRFAAHWVTPAQTNEEKKSEETCHHPKLICVLRQLRPSASLDELKNLYRHCTAVYECVVDTEDEAWMAHRRLWLEYVYQARWVDCVWDDRMFW